MFNQMSVNPAYAGSKEALSVAVLHRNQWTSMPGAPLTNTFFAHGPLASKHIGLGVTMTQESIGPKKWFSAYGNFAYRFRLGKGKVSLGLSGGMVNYNFNWNAIEFQDQNDIVYQQLALTNTRTRIGVNTGAYYYDQSFYVGVSVSNINQPYLFKYDYKDTSGVNQTAYVFRVSPHSFLTIGKGWKINESLVFNPAIVVRHSAGQINGDLNLNFLLKNRLWLGASLRSKYGYMGLLQFMVNDKFKIGYCYDAGINKIGIAGRATHEIMLNYNFSISKSKMISPRYL
jgi:type IX secretion system PorP/SprF family membrane protein